jgi:hypothetical protein
MNLAIHRGGDCVIAVGAIHHGNATQEDREQLAMKTKPFSSKVGQKWT